jgi:hypothetical protein
VKWPMKSHKTGQIGNIAQHYAILKLNPCCKAVPETQSHNLRRNSSHFTQYECIFLVHRVLPLYPSPETKTEYRGTVVSVFN